MVKLLRLCIKVLPFVYMGMVWTLSSMPADAVVNFSVGDEMIKESLHLVEFAILYVLLVCFFLVDGKLTKRLNLYIAIFACFYGLLDEIHQSFVPYRSATLIDFVKDVTGVVVSYWIVVSGYFLERNVIGKWMRAFEDWFQRSSSAS